MTRKVEHMTTTTRIINVLRYGYGFTSLAGISQSRASDCKLHKWVWILFFVVGFSLTTYQVINALLTFTKHNTETSITLINKVRLDFPSVTVCNQNRVHCRHLYNLILDSNKTDSCCKRKELYCKLFIMSHCIVSLKIAGRFETEYGIDWEPICVSNETMNDTSFSPELNNTKGCKNDSKLISPGGPYYSKRITPNGFYDIYLKLTMDEVIAIAHQPRDMIKSCKFDDMPGSENCKELIDGSVKIFSPQYGVCYGFNILGRNTNRTSAYSNYGGPKFGLQLVLNIEEHYYMRNAINEKYGAHIVVEHNKKNPSMSKGIDAMPGTETNVGMQKHVIKRLMKPYKSNCTNEYRDEIVKLYVDKEFEYSSKICKGVCFSAEMYTKCGCVHPSLLEGFGIEKWFSSLSRTKPCNTTVNSKDFACVQGINWTETGASGSDWDQPCQCNSECTEISYESRVSSSSWPHDGIWPEMIEAFGVVYKSKTFDALTYVSYYIDGPDCYHDSGFYEGKEELDEFRQKNYMKVNVFFESLDEDVVQELKQFTSIFDFLNTLGGAFSLFLGASLISILELWEIVIRIVFALFQ